MSRHDGDFIYLIIIGGIFTWKGFRDLKTHKKIAGLATSRARSMAMGLVELAGIAKMVPTPRVDPVFQKPCCYYHLKVEEHRGSGKNSRWVTLLEESSDGNPFICQDSTGEVLIMPKKPDLHFNNQLVYRNGIFGTNDTVVKNYLRSKWSGLSSLRLTLNVLREGDPLFVVGCALSKTTTLNKKKELKNNPSLSDIAREIKQNKKHMEQLDINKDGVVDSQEWENGMKAYQRFLEEKKNQSIQNQDPEKPLTFEGIVTETDEHELILANNEKDLLSKLGPIAYLQIIGGGIALGFGLIQLLKHLL